MRKLEKWSRYFIRGLVAIAGFYLLLCFLLWRYQTRLIFFPSTHIKSVPTDVRMAYEDVFLAVREDQLHGWWIPSDTENTPTILYLHGNGSNVGDLVARTRILQQLGYRLFLLDYRGYGRSSGPFPNEKRVYEDAETAWRYLTERRGIPPQRIIIYGRSLGSAIAFHLAIRHPDAAGIIVESPFPSMRVVAASRLPLLPVDWLLNQHFDSLEKVRDLQIPVLAIWGTADREIPPTSSQILYNAIPTAKTRVLIEGGGHTNLPRLGGDRYTTAIQDFIEQYAN
ncbi:alpha/beta hydrolase [Spirulina sp. 06S082]|uniref:alpha/beta hydrolase n=1 Tax=Spirulina sp. 06S082 TaxID=3110248 RepID=UPI002B20F36A|nr:alpha/beta fold hydrolase [Spirulina sp. 06S082]MEA5471094.1 alpha/beta fold hydrolase [Spirulina sp. 06S082]